MSIWGHSVARKGLRASEHLTVRGAGGWLMVCGISRAGWRAWTRCLSGRPVTALDLLVRSAGPMDRSWRELSLQFSDALDAWRKNPLARRIIGLTTSYVVGDGITLASEYGPLKRYLTQWWNDPKNLIDLRLTALSDELARAGELFIVLHFNRADGISYLRTVPASLIDGIKWAPGDYEQETSYHEAVGLEDPDYANGGRTWYAAAALTAGFGASLTDEADEKGRYKPMMLHFAVNRPAGCVRGESDLATILPWLQRYSFWLEERVMLNAAVRAFLWIVKVAKANVATRQASCGLRPSRAASR